MKLTSSWIDCQIGICTGGVLLAEDNKLAIFLLDFRVLLLVQILNLERKIKIYLRLRFIIYCEL
jgi:hypothetical protein